MNLRESDTIHLHIEHYRQIVHRSNQVEDLESKNKALQARVEKLEGALKEIRNRTNDCVCDEPDEDGHDSTDCHIFFIADVALAPPEGKL